MKQSKVLSPLFHLADFDRFPPSVENLNPILTANGISVLPSFRYNGKDASATTWVPWGYGQTLTREVAGTAPSYNQGSPLLGTLDDSVKFGGVSGDSSYYSSDTSYGSFGTNDAYLEQLVYINPTIGVTGSPISKVTSVDYIGGYASYTTNANVMTFAIFQDSTNWYNASAGALGAGWYLFQTFFNNSISNNINAVKSFYNSIAITTTKSGSPSANFNYTTTAKLRLGRYLDNVTSLVFNGNVAYIGLWLQSSWFSDVDFTELTTVASTRFAQLIGIYPNQSRGTYLPSVATRNSVSYLEKLEENGTKKLYLVGTNWIRSNSTIDNNNKPLKGLLIEPSSTNNLLQSETFQTTWTSGSILSTNINVINSPNGQLTSDGLICSSSNTTHFITQSPSLTNGAKYCFSVFAKAGNKNWIGLSNDTLSSSIDSTGMFDITNNIVGTKGTLLSSSGLISYQNGWYRPYIVFNATNGSNSLRIYISNDNSLSTWAGDDSTTNMYVWGAQLELGSYPSSYIPTTTAAVTRAADSLRYVATNNINPSKGSLIYDIYTPSYDIPSSSCPICISNAGSSTIQIASKIDPINDATCLNIYNTSLQCSISGSTDIGSGKIYTIKNSWNSDFAGLEVNQTSEGTDSSIISVPTGLDRIDLSDQSTANQFGGLIKNIKIYDDVLGKGKLK